MKAYENFKEKARGKEQDERVKMAREMKSYHDSICQELYAKGEQGQIKEHINAYNSAKKEILPKKARPTVPMTATNIYDNDDRPTTY